MTLIFSPSNPLLSALAQVWVCMNAAVVFNDENVVLGRVCSGPSVLGADQCFIKFVADFFSVASPQTRALFRLHLKSQEAKRVKVSNPSNRGVPSDKRDAVLLRRSKASLKPLKSGRSFRR